MNRLLIIRLLGRLLLIEAGFMVPSLAVALYFGQGDAKAFAIAIATISTVFLVTELSTRKKGRKASGFTPKDAFLTTGLGWIILSLFGALPFYFSGAIEGFVNCFFESVSGLTTTGATILANVEVDPLGILFWRATTHWIGGMGILVLSLAIIPHTGGRAHNILRAESPGPTSDRIVPKIGDGARILYSIYIALTVGLTVLLLVSGMPLYDAVVHSMGTIATGGYSNRAMSVSTYESTPINVILTVFMLLSGVNFAVYYQTLTGRWKGVLKNSELRLYLAMAAVSTVIFTADTYLGGYFRSFAEALEHSSFQAASIITTTGFFSADYNAWPTLSKSVIILLMLTGACAGSTGGGLKVSRLLIMLKSFKIQLYRILHPRSVKNVSIDGKAISGELVSSVAVYFFGYLAVILAGTLLVSVDDLGFASSFTATLSCVSSVGRGFDLTGPIGSFALFSSFSKIVLSMCMLIGRLEIFPILLLFMPETWKKS